jgi:hypothetical protein
MECKICLGLTSVDLRNRDNDADQTILYFRGEFSNCRLHFERIREKHGGCEFDFLCVMIEFAPWIADN